MNQKCPLCKTKIESDSHFPLKLCLACREKITDRKGNRIIYKFDKSPKGFKAFYKDKPGQDYIYDLCYVGNNELKAFSDGKSEIIIQPINFQNYASRPDDIFSAEEEYQSKPYDPEKRKLRKKQVAMDEIILPAAYVSIFSLVPLVLGYLGLNMLKNNNWFYYFFFTVMSLFCLARAYKLIKTRVRKFYQASYFKQHSYAFFIFGILCVLFFLFLPRLNLF